MKVITKDSPESASYRTDIKGWVSRNGRFYGEDENQARLDGCTHEKCEICGAIFERSDFSICKECKIKEQIEKYKSFPEKEWDEKEPVCLYLGNIAKYFFDIESLEEYIIEELDVDTLETEDLETEDLDNNLLGGLRLVFCDKVTPKELDVKDLFVEFTDDNKDFPEAVVKAVKDLNKAVKDSGLCYYIPSHTRVLLKINEGILS